EAVVVEDLGALQFCLVCELGRRGTTICLEIGDFRNQLEPGYPGARTPYTPGVAAGDHFTIAHISDLHCGGPYFVPNLMERAVSEINDLAPDICLWSGCANTFGVGA